MPDIPKYNGTTDPNEHITTYTCGIKGNDLEDDEIESVLSKKIEETLSNEAMVWYHNLPPNSIDSFTMLADYSVKAHARVIKVATRKSNIFKIRQTDNKMLREFMSRFQMVRMKLPPVTDDWVIQAFTQGLNEWRLRMTSWSPSDSIHPNGLAVKALRYTDKEPRSNRELYQPYGADQRNSGLGLNPPRNYRRNDRGKNSRGLISKNGFD
uniref:Retrotransposon gag domain-containing protein n=1 Tax=Nicotiana tabacum TaxID=4097 RepID=A0A1S4C422_TOBAC|nr:PREDICTED: uncharacterized protein LOC107814926 [Nicotiana tabacum]